MTSRGLHVTAEVPAPKPAPPGFGPPPDFGDGLLPFAYAGLSPQQQARGLAILAAAHLTNTANPWHEDVLLRLARRLAHWVEHGDRSEPTP